ncbi:MAG: hypothetical protein COS67_08795 [Deltaproteobacteria bacterium CG06_land_8_20_14_3_00_44_19]|nr:MAG: hypothetical protein COS67_08795 [Deltaproteobacteria bacterium CG06_land_8_20_14_3_00_44_19]
MRWPEIPLSILLEDSQNGIWGSPPREDGSDLPVLRSTNIHNAALVLNDVAFRSVPEKSAKRYKLLDGDIIVTTSSGSRHLIGKNALFQQPEDGQRYLFSNFTLRLRPRRDVISPRYLHLYLNSSKAKAELLRLQNTTSGLRNLPIPLYLAQAVPLPPLSEQRRIVEILDQADALRKKRAEADAKAARILPALFYKMFGDPATNPKGWPVKQLGDPQVTTINPRFSSAGVSANTQFSFLPMADVDEVWGRTIGRQVRSYSDVMRGFTPFQDSDVLFAKITPCMQNGKAAIARNLVNGHGFGSTEFHILRSGPLATPEWLYALVRLLWFKKQAEASFTGTVGQQRVPADFLARYTIGCPPIGLQRRFAKALVRLQEWVDQTDQSRKSLENLFSVLLYRAFTGDLTAKWREAHMKELLEEMEQQAKALNLRVEP